MNNLNTPIDLLDGSVDLHKRQTVPTSYTLRELERMHRETIEYWKKLLKKGDE